MTCHQGCGSPIGHCVARCCNEVKRLAFSPVARRKLEGVEDEHSAVQESLFGHGRIRDAFRSAIRALWRRAARSRRRRRLRRLRLEGVLAEGHLRAPVSRGGDPLIHPPSHPVVVPLGAGGLLRGRGDGAFDGNGLARPRVLRENFLKVRRHGHGRTRRDGGRHWSDHENELDAATVALPVLCRDCGWMRGTVSS